MKNIIIAFVAVMACTGLGAEAIDGSSIDRYHDSRAKIEMTLSREKRAKFAVACTSVAAFFQAQQVISDLEDFELVEAALYCKRPADDLLPWSG